MVCCRILLALGYNAFAKKDTKLQLIHLLAGFTIFKSPRLKWYYLLAF